jgi:adenylosuccinate lyase
MSSAISCLDTRYFNDVKDLINVCDDFAYYRNRIYVELKYFELFTSSTITYNPLIDFTYNDYLDILKSEAILRHDVKAIEYFIKALPEVKETGKSHLIHIGLTSQDVNSLGFMLCFRDTCFIILENLKKLINTFTEQLITPYLEKNGITNGITNDILMLSFTHGQPATPTHFSKEMLIYKTRIEHIYNEMNEFIKTELTVKFGGATGEFNSLSFSLPDTNWKEWADHFIEGFSIEGFSIEGFSIEGFSIEGFSPSSSLAPDTSSLATEKLTPSCTSKSCDNSLRAGFSKSCFSKSCFSKSCFKRTQYTNQCDNYDSIINVLYMIKRMLHILEHLRGNLWLYIHREYFIQKNIKTEIGSSTMPQKINPIDLENAKTAIEMAKRMIDGICDILTETSLQRDISDSSALRNISSVVGYVLISLKKMTSGISRLTPNVNKIKEELQEHPEIILEGIQTYLKIHCNIENSYEIMKEKSRGNKITLLDIYCMIDELEIDEVHKLKLKHLTPENYK